MLFNSWDFLLFFPLVCVIYFLIPVLKYRNLFLLGASYYFYMCWDATYALLLLTSTGITYLAALCIAKCPLYKKIFLCVSIILNLLILFFFKYYEFAATNIMALMDVWKISIHIPEFKVLLPVGISFYIFQALGYSIDVYRKDMEVEKNFFIYALFVSFFPQLVAGPIERSTNLLKQFYVKHRFNTDRAFSGIELMIWGYFLKLGVADRCAIYVDGVFNNVSSHEGFSSLLASILFCFQLYGDFAGYSYIAIGVAQIMGFHLMENFRRPYFYSVSVQDFWKRNHISLTTWFMDYIYYPMVGSSISVFWWCFSIFFTFFVSGFWHGANWTYVISFSIFGIYLVICILKSKRQGQFEKKYGLKKKTWWLVLNRITTFLLVCFALIFFRANAVSDALEIIKQIFVLDNSFAHNRVILLACSILIGIVFIKEYYDENSKKFPLKRYIPKERYYVLKFVTLLVLVSLFGVFTGSKFIYFQF